MVFFPQESMPPILRGEILLDRMGPQARVNYEQLKKDSLELELQIKQLQVSKILELRHALSSANTLEKI